MELNDDLSGIGTKYSHLKPSIIKFTKDIEMILDYMEMNLEEDNETQKQIIAIQRAIKVYYRTLEYNSSDSDGCDSDENEKILSIESMESIGSIECDKCPSKDICHSCCGKCELHKIIFKSEENNESFDVNIVM